MNDRWAAKCGTGLSPTDGTWDTLIPNTTIHGTWSGTSSTNGECNVSVKGTIPEATASSYSSFRLAANAFEEGPNATYFPVVLFLED